MEDKFYEKMLYMRRRIDKRKCSEEHIIPNAIGGKLKSKELICKKCNSKLGHSMDKELAEQLDFFF